MSDKTVEVHCPRCGRKRRVARHARAAVGLGQGVPPLSVSAARTCRTCRLLASIEDHRVAIEHLMRQVEDRRMRGL